MWLHILIGALCSVVVINGASDDIDNETTVFRKCCTDHQSLMKILKNETASDEQYECVDREWTEVNYNISIYPLLVGESVVVEHVIPGGCDDLKMVHVTDSETEINMWNNQCYDKLVIEIMNGTIKQNIPKIVALSCVQNETEDIPKSKFKIDYVKKCCPRGQRYDTIHHVCKHVIAENNENLLKQLKLNVNDIYDVKSGLHCKSDEYAVELSEEKFSLSVEGSTLIAVGRSGERGGRAPQGEWCVDRQHQAPGLVARVCTRDCSAYGVYCVRKCCAVGEHYRPRRCGSFGSKCVPNIDDAVSFNISSYLEPLKRDFGDFADAIGIRSDLHCPKGRFVLNRTSSRDRHWLTRDGIMESPHLPPTNDYCLEAIDGRGCGYDVIVTAIRCYVETPQPNKNFFSSFVVISISSVCLALTLVVYCVLPELRNLHGRTLICHVSMMLLAFTCLARVQYGIVSDQNVCIMLGYGIYFGFVAAFAWLNVMCFDIWWTFGNVRTVQGHRKSNAERRRFVWYSVYAWSVAILLTLTTFLMDEYPVTTILDANMGHGICWFGSVQNTETDWPHYIFFVIPMGIATCTNFVLWVLTARYCARVKSEVHRLQAGSIGDRAKQRFRVDRAKYVLTGKLWVVMGAGWVSELLSTLASEPKWLWTVIDLLNELQGVFIFMILVCKPKLFRLIKKRLGLEKPEAQKNATSSSSARTSSTFLSRTISSDERTNLRISLPNNVKQS